MENQTIQNPMQAEIPIQPSKRFPILSIVLVFISLLLLLFTAFLTYQNIQLQKQVVALRSTPSPTSDVTPDSTANWKTYTNSTNDYSFKYPPNLTSDTGATGDGFGGVRFAYIGPRQYPKTETELSDGYVFSVTLRGSVSSKNTVDSVTQGSREGACPDVSMIGETKKTFLAGREAQTYTVNCLILDYTEYFVSDGKIIYQITQAYLGEPNDQVEYKKIVDQILSTFKFLEDEQATETSCIYQGKTYKDGDGVPSPDKCNSCSCENGQIACTLMVCE